MPVLGGYQVICSRSINKMEQESIIMIPITEKEEKSLDNGYLHWVREEGEFVIDNTNKPIYGNIDFNTNSDDYNVIENMNWLDYRITLGIHVPSNYDYKEHCCYSDTKRYKTYDTLNPAVVTQYKHALMGKPERVCIFRKKRYGYKKS